MISLNHIHLQIGNQILLENENINLYEGYIHVINGESGCGKTTLLYEISLFSSYSKGRYLWGDKRIDKLDENEKADLRRNHIGYVLQDLEVINEKLSLKDNIKCMYALTGQEYNSDEVNNYLKKLNLHLSLNQHIDEMSRGERQRFALLLALIKKADLIVCDEPTSALDIENSLELIKYLKMIASDYHKIIVIASHDEIVINDADVLYKIEDRHLKKIYDKKVNIYKRKEKETKKEDRSFFALYSHSQKNRLNLSLKIVYILMILILCLAPIVLDEILSKQEEIYSLFANNEIIIAHQSSNSRYDEASSIFDIDEINMIKEIEHVEKIVYYWELDGILMLDDDSIPVLIVPKDDIDNIVISSKIESDYLEDIKLYSTLSMDEESYNFDIITDNYVVRDYPPIIGVNKEIVYIPYDMLKELLQSKNITTSGSLIIYCDDVTNIEIVTKEIQKCFLNVNAYSNTIFYMSQINLIANMQDYIIVLRIVMIIGIMIISYLIQMMENRKRRREINNLRINGANQEMFYKLTWYENKNVLFISLFLSILGYIIIINIFKVHFSLLNITLLLMKEFINIIITKLIPLSISIRQLFGEDIAFVLRKGSF